MEAATAIQSRLIGAILVEKNLISNEQLEHALKVQAETGERIGEIVVAEFGISRLELAGVLAEQWADLEHAESKAIHEPAREPGHEPDESSPPEAPLTPADVHLRRPLGEIFVDLGFVSNEELDAALDTQRETGARIGEILVEQGSLTRLDLASALAEQWSALQKLRPPAPVADLQPWQNGQPLTSPPEHGVASDDRPAIAALEARLSVVERAAAATPWHEDLRLVTAEFRAAVRSVEERLESVPGVDTAAVEEALASVNARIAALESGSTSAELATLRTDLEELKAQPAPESGVAELRAAIERLERRPIRDDEISQLSVEIAALATRVDGLDAVGELNDKLGAVADRAEAAQAEVAELSRRMESIAGLEGRLDEVAARMPDDENIAELRRSVAALSARADGDEQPDRGNEIAVLSARVEEIAAAIPTVETGALAARIESLEEEGRVGNVALERLTAELGELGSRTHERLDSLTNPEPASPAVDELRARVDDLAATIDRAPDGAVLDGIERRLSELAAAVEATPDGRELEGLRFRLDEMAAAVQREPAGTEVADLDARLNALAATIHGISNAPLYEDLQERFNELSVALGRKPDAAGLDELRARLDELVAEVHHSPGPAHVDELSTRVDTLAATVGRAPDTRVFDAMQARLTELAASLEQKPDAAGLDELRRRLEELALAVEQDTSIGTLGERVGELERRLVSAVSVTDVRDELRRVTEGTVAERESLAQELFARVEEITATVPRESELSELRMRLDELASRPTADAELEAKVDSVAARLEDLGVVEGAIADLRAALAEVDGVRAGEALVTGERLARLEPAVDSIAGLAERIREGDDLADRARILASRLDGTETRLASLDVLEQRITTLTEEVSTRPDGNAVEELVSSLRAEIAVVADRPTIADPGERIQSLSDRLDHLATESNGRIDAFTEDLDQRIRGVVEELGRRVDDVARRADGLVGRDEAAATAAEQAAWVRTELGALRELTDGRWVAVDSVLVEAERARAAEREELESRLEGAVAGLRSDLAAQEHALRAALADESGTIRSEVGEHQSAFADRVANVVESIQGGLEAQGQGLVKQLQGQQSDVAALRARVEELQEAAAGRSAWEARLEGMLEQRFAELEGRVTDEVAATRADADEAAAAVRAELSSLAGRVDEVLTLRHSDVKAARKASERLAQSVSELAELRIEDAEAAQAAAADLSTRLDELAVSLRADAASARSAADELAARVAGQIGELHGLRTDDLAASDLAGAELAARLDDHALRSAAAAFEVEQAIREEMGGIAARLEERDVQAIEAREELRGELERATSSMGWRLERIEESLAADDSTELKAGLAELERRLEGHAALGEEQVRVTERALRKGLASLGERLVDTQSAYADAGNALRRSIERLGAAVVEADARMADQIPVSAVEGCVAFAPTAAGYRLVELPGAQPEIGATVELEGCDGPLVVTRYGRSPLPLDSRPCAYLDRA